MSCNEVASWALIVFIFFIPHCVVANDVPQTSTEVRTVSTATLFQRAVRDGVRHIILTDHIKADEAQAQVEGDWSSRDNAIADLQASTKSIVGNCTTPAPEGWPLSNTLPSGACAVLVPEDFIELHLGVTDLWINNLYAIVDSKAALDESSTLILHKDGSLWISNCTFQGRGFNSRGIDMNTNDGGRPRLYVENSVFSDFHRDHGSAIRLMNASFATITSTAFKRNVVEATTDPRWKGVFGSSVAMLNRSATWLQDISLVDQVVFNQDAGAKAVSFRSGPPGGGPDTGEVYSDPPMAIWDYLTAQSVPALPASTVPNRFLRKGNVLDGLRQEQATFAAAIPGTGSGVFAALGPDVPATSDGGNAQVGVIVGSAAGAAVLVALLSVAIAVLRRKPLPGGRDERPSQHAHNCESKHPEQWPEAPAADYVHRSRSTFSQATDDSCPPPAGIHSTLHLPPLSPFASTYGAASHTHTPMHTHRTSGGPRKSDGHHSLAVQAARSRLDVTVISTTSSEHPHLERSAEYSDTHGLPSRASSDGGSPAHIHGLHALAMHSLNSGQGTNSATISSSTPNSVRNVTSLTSSRDAGQATTGSALGALVRVGSARSSQVSGTGTSTSELPPAVGSTTATHEGAQQAQGGPQSLGLGLGPLGLALRHHGGNSHAGSGPGAVAAQQERTQAGARSAAGTQSGTTKGTLATTFDITNIMTLPFPPYPGDTLHRELLEKALDNLYNNRRLFMGQFELLGPLQRRAGGQGVVQFARSTHSTEGVAIKFFMNRKAFDCEEALYMRAGLRGMMPAITMIENNDTGVAVAQKGWAFPPFIVVERGESLDEWQRRIQPDFATIVQVLSHVAERVQTLHALGIAHRDLKPGNVLWRPLKHSWTLIDFGCAAEIGSTARLTFSLAFSPPETLQELQRGASSIVADAAADMWALGVIAFELTTRAPAFPVMLWKQDDVITAACGKKAYPWEDEVGAFRTIPELRILSGVVKGCLAREPRDRPSAGAVLGQLHSLFDFQGPAL